MLNNRHLHYCWVVTKEGGIARAAERLDRAVQNISAQVRELEKALGHQLLNPSGRRSSPRGRLTGSIDLLLGPAAIRASKNSRRKRTFRTANSVKTEADEH